MAEIGLGVGTNMEGRRMRRFGGWGGELKRWLKEVKRVCCVYSPEKKRLA
jgi:hypothetical protein